MLGEVFGHYRVLEILGRGGMGVVYRAEDTRLRRQVALKFLPEALLRSPVSRERFQREARTASAINHPNICTIYDVGEQDGQPFIAMELLDGVPLNKMLSEGPIPFENLTEWAEKIADALG